MSIGEGRIPKAACIRIGNGWGYGNSVVNLLNPNSVMCDNWMGMAMLGTKKNATAGIRNSNFAEMAYENGWNSRCLPSVICVGTGTERHRKKRVLTWETCSWYGSSARLATSYAHIDTRRTRYRNAGWSVCQFSCLPNTHVGLFSCFIQRWTILLPIFTWFLQPVVWMLMQCTPWLLTINPLHRLQTLDFCMVVRMTLTRCRCVWRVVQPIAAAWFWVEFISRRYRRWSGGSGTARSKDSRSMQIYGRPQRWWTLAFPSVSKRTSPRRIWKLRT